MVHQQAYRAAVDGKHPVNKVSRLAETFACSRRLAFAAAAFFVASTGLGHAQSGPFAGMAGNWSGGGTITLDDGSRERIRCRASYQVAGPNMTMTLTCASDAYKFNLARQCRRPGRTGLRHLERGQPQHLRHPAGPRRRRQFPGRRQHGRLQRQHLAAHDGQQADGLDARRQPVPRRRYLAVEVTRDQPIFDAPGLDPEGVLLFVEAMPSSAWRAGPPFP